MDEILRFTQLGFELNAILDRDHGEGSHREEAATIGEANDHIEDGSLFDWLAGYDLDNLVDLSMLDADDRAAILEAFGSLANAVDPGRKLGVREGGINLLIAYCLECVQRVSRERRG
jgi:hypothetical protein